MVPPAQVMVLAILVVDGSGSMTESAAGRITKAQATNTATRELFSRFRASSVAANFQFAVIAFDDAPSVRLPPTPCGPLLDDNGDYDPLVGHGGGTSIHSALLEAERMSDAFLASAPFEGVPHSVVMLVMSDGCCGEPDRTRDTADRIKSRNGGRVRICSALFATVGAVDKAGAELLRDIASDPVMGYKTVYDAETLRAFFERSTSAASGVQLG